MWCLCLFGWFLPATAAARALPRGGCLWSTSMLNSARALSSESESELMMCVSLSELDDPEESEESAAPAPCFGLWWCLW